MNINNSHDLLPGVLGEEFRDELLFQGRELALLEGYRRGKSLAELILLEGLVAALSFAFDYTAEGLEGCEERDTLNEQVEFPWNDVQGHALICNQQVMRDILVYQVVQHDPCGMR